MQKDSYILMEVVAMITGYRHSETFNHSRRVERFTRILLHEAIISFPDLNLSDAEQKLIAEASILHDIGKNALPDRVLYRQGKLSEKERELFQTHTLRGEEMVWMLSPLLEKEEVRYLKDICRYHHERYDGRGYPDGLIGDEIPFAAQVVGMADAYDEMVSERLYKPAYSTEEAYERIISGECGIFSSRLIGCFMRVQEELKKAADEKPVVLI